MIIFAGYEDFSFIFTWLARAIYISWIYYYLCSLWNNLWLFQLCQWTHRRAWKSCRLLRGDSMISLAKLSQLCWGATSLMNCWLDLFSIDYIFFTDFRINLISIPDNITFNLDISLEIANLIISFLTFIWQLWCLCISYLLKLSINVTVIPCV